VGGGLNFRAEMIIMTPMSPDAASGMSVSVRAFSAICLGLMLLFPGLSRAPAEEAPTKGKILAVYEVNLAGFSLGEFRLRARFQGSSYELKGEGSFSLFFGQIYKASGDATSAGKFRGVGLAPASFTVEFEGGGKKEMRRLSFARGGVSNVSVVPPKWARRRVPVTQDQLAGVLDPLSALFLHAGAVCDETMKVYDGVLRFDIVLTPKRAEQLPNEAPASLSGPATVCSAKFVPVGGYKPDNPAMKYLSQTDQIEAWLVRLPQTTLHVPYWIGVPTPFGRGSATLTKLRIDLD
jgi:Protein of unknown function (DUF3108)